MAEMRQGQGDTVTGEPTGPVTSTQCCLLGRLHGHSTISFLDTKGLSYQLRARGISEHANAQLVQGKGEARGGGVRGGR